MSGGWQAAQDRLRHRISAARVARENEPSGQATPLSAPLQPPELVGPAIVSHRPVVGPPIRVVKRTLHRLLVPLVFAPQAEFNLRVATRINESKAVEEQLNDLSAISNEHRRRIDELTEGLAELRGEVLAVRAEVQSQRALIETETKAAAAETADAASGGAG